jgi:translocation and assembly module TamB
VRELRAEAGAARAVLAFDARRAAADGWLLRSSGTLTDFDPLPWWPGSEGSAWRAGTHRLSGSWSLDVALPRVRPDMAPLALAQAIAGTGLLRVDRSLVAGVPVSLQLELGNRPGSGAAPGSVRGELVAGGNRLAVEGQGNPAGDGHADRLRFDLQAGNLATLAPLARLLPDLASWAPRAGQVDASLALDGRWPDIRSEGKASLVGLQVGTLEARRAQASWRFDTASDQPLLLQADAQGLVQGSATARAADGRPARHLAPAQAGPVSRLARQPARGAGSGAGLCARPPARWRSCAPTASGRPTATAAAAGAGAWRS